ncbi:hypothetical protein O6H91_23G017100 [Diphasiastrum complanatum]|nr:hypothetical protein O6H91_23G017100 [Diphasiastrum complanatum]
MKALELFQEMYVDGVIPDKYTFIPVLKACAGLASLEWGKHIHAQIFQSGYESDIFVASCLVDMYAKCWSIEDAFRVFNNMSKHDAVSWSAMIAGYVHCGQGKRALELFERMQQAQVLPDSVTFLSVLTACAILSALPEGRHVHARIIHNKCESDVIVSNALIDMYAKCGSPENSCKVFNNMRSRNVISWNTMIVGYAKWGHGEKAFNLFSQMLRERVQPNSVTFVGVLIACTSIGALEEGRYIHAHAIRIGCQTEAFIASGLIDMYAKCGSLDDASNIFSSMPIADVVSWNAMIAGYARCGEAGKALQLFYQMQMEHVKPDSVTFLGVLNACGIIGALNIGRDIHTQIIESGFESHLSVRSCLVEMYTKCGSIDDAYNVFCSMPFHDVVSWNSMILGYVKLGMSEKALRLFSRMQKEGVEPNNVSFMGAVNACASLASLEKGRLVHENIVQSGYGADLSVSNCLIDMYAKCGSIGEACMVFKNMPARTMVSWSVMLGSCAMHGLGKEALRLFAILCHEGLEFDEMTLVSVLTACNHAGLVDEGCYLFEALSPVYDISASTEHYSCVVDMLGRSGYLEEAEELVQIMSSQPDNAVWMALLSACKKYGNLQMGERVAKQILVLDPKNVSAYVLLSTIYASRGHMDSKARIQQIRMERKMQSQAEALP